MLQETVNDDQQYANVLCCICGITIKANQANMCVSCIQSRYDITQGVGRQVTIFKCRGCERYQRDAQGWLPCEPESRELLAFCLKRIPGLKKVKLVDAAFIWTEPHSKRLKVRVTVQGQVVNDVILQQSCVVEFIVHNKMCEDCHRSEAKLTWNAVVQARQNVGHKRTFLFLEQVILKHKAHENTLSVATQPNGVDFFFAKRNEAVKLLDFLESVAPVKWKEAKKLISADIKSNSATFNYTYSLEIVPICKDDLVCLPKSTAAKLGNISQLCVCTQVFNVVRLIDPLTCEVCELSGEKFWMKPFRALISAPKLVEFIVLDVNFVEMQKRSLIGAGSKSNADADEDDIDEEEEDDDANSEDQEEENEEDDHNDAMSVGKQSESDRKSRATNADVITIKKKRRRAARQKKNHSSAGRGAVLSSKHQLAEVEVARARDIGVNDNRFTVLSHLGFVLKPGDSVLGYDSENAVFNDDDAKGYDHDLPPVVLIRKHFPKWRSKERERGWMLKSMALEAPDAPGLAMGVNVAAASGSNGSSKKALAEAAEAARRDYEMFMRDLEEDEEMRSRINIYKKESTKASTKAKSDAISSTNASSSNNNDNEEDEYEEDAPTIPLEELIQEMNISSDNEDGEGNDEDEDL